MIYRDNEIILLVFLYAVEKKFIYKEIKIRSVLNFILSLSVRYSRVILRLLSKVKVKNFVFS